MKLVYSYWNFQIVFQENEIAQLILEEPGFFWKTVNQLKRQIESGEGEFILSTDTIQKIDKCCDMVIDYTAIDVNHRKVLSALYQELKENANDDELYQKTNALTTAVVQYMDSLTGEIEIPLRWNLDVDLGDLFKSMELRIEPEGLSFAEQLLQYMEVMKEYCDVQLFIFVNLKDFVSEEELQRLYQDIFYRKLRVLLIESSSKYSLQGEKTWVIDKDLCEIY